MEKSPDQPQQKPAPEKPTGLPMFVPGISGMPQMFQPFPPIQALYANGFEISVTGPDVLVTFSQNGRVLMTLNLSFTTAKALGRGLADTVKNLEEKSQTKVLFVDEITKALQLPAGENQ